MCQEMQILPHDFLSKDFLSVCCGVSKAASADTLVAARPTNMLEIEQQGRIYLLCLYLFLLFTDILITYILITVILIMDTLSLGQIYFLLFF